MRHRTKKITTCAIFSAIICIFTAYVAVPAPVVGNINVGDLFILCASWLLGPLYGAISGGVVACLADLISGFAIYAPATLIIKMLLAVVSYYAFATMSKITKFKPLSLLISSTLAELIMVFGYFFYESIIYGVTTAIASIPFNMIQGTVCLTLGTIVGYILLKSKTVQRFSSVFLHII